MSSVLEMAVLGLLKEQDMHGYELKKRLSDVFGLSSAVSFGSLYPALARLEAAGAVRVVTTRERPGSCERRPAAARNGGRAGAGRSTASRLSGPKRSRSCWRTARAAARMNVLSTCGLPSPATFHQRAASGCSSSAGPCLVNAWPRWQPAHGPGETTATCGSWLSVSRTPFLATFPGWTILSRRSGPAS